ncbi:MAG: hypothetical protein CMF12_08460 [Idiomarina sp.]|uniref:hypothetical protein n=1 Tax=Idiomarina sp. TaxID=1874361 RepID=UPI000C6AE323|nr:hypothetical protein [Idiomarina sp.]MBT42541.1 hypothetical protein [Idiomarina sp.]
MMALKKTMLVTALAGALLSGNALALQDDDKTNSEETPSNTPSRSEFSEQVKSQLNQFGEIKGIQEIPITKLYFVEATEGNYIISGSGRFAIRGTIQDVWHRKTLRSVADVQDTIRMPLSQMNFDFDNDLASIQVGNSDIPRQGIVFVDPTSEYTQEMTQLILDGGDKYNFTFIMLPAIGGEEAAKRSLHILCAPDREAAIQDMANGTSTSFLDTTEGCGDHNLMFTAYMQEIFRIKNLPHIIREDGLVSNGIPVKFDEWLESK